MSYRTIVNKVLRRLRESTVSADWIGNLTENTEVDDYAQLIGDLVNESKLTVEDAWKWSSLRAIVAIATSADTNGYTITGASNRTSVLQVIDNTNNNVLTHMSDAAFYNYQYVGDQTSSVPISYRLSGTTIDFYPTPAGIYDIKIHVVTPQEDLTEAATVLTVPELPVVLGAYVLALAERGEDGGTGAGPAASRYASVLADSISLDESRTVDESVWYAS
tara:strand:- start:277 stop:933 length:657 start_codon:yes stop_codon:yes gene_type:complete